MRLLLVEDNANIAELICQLLEQNNFIVDHFDTVELAKEAIRQQSYNLVIIDRGLPDGDGLDILTDLSKIYPASELPPFLVLSAWGETSDIVRGLNIGAVDYMTKPYESDELLARIRSNIRQDRRVVRQKVILGNIIYEPNHMHVKINDKAVQLGRRQLCIFEALLNNKDKIVTHARLEKAAYGYDDQIVSNSLTSQISRLRKTLKDTNANVEIRGIRNIGYIMKESNT